MLEAMQMLDKTVQILLVLFLWYCTPVAFALTAGDEPPVSQRRLRPE